MGYSVKMNLSKAIIIKDAKLKKLRKLKKLLFSI